MNLTYQCISSPIGPLHLVERDGRLCTVAFDDRWEAPGDLTAGQVAAAAALRAYFAGDLGAIDAVETDPQGTEFQRLVWAELRKVPCGGTASYADIARTIGRPRATRAVGTANGANPIAIVLPCHRIIGASGALTGYGGGLDRKRWLLAHEGALAAHL